MAQIYDKDGNPIDVGGNVNIVRQLVAGTKIATINGIQLYAPTSSGGGGGNSSTPYGKRAMGVVKYQPFVNDAINHIVEYGQSLSRGSYSKAITTTTENGCYMLGSNPADLSSSATSFRLLKNIDGTEPGEGNATGEDMVVATVHALKYLCMQNGVAAEFLGTSSGVGGRPIDSFVKNPRSSDRYYTNNFLTHITRAKAAATAANKTIVCPAIMYIQGEDDYSKNKQYAAGSLIDDSLPVSASKFRPAIDYYKQQLVQLKNDMQADIMATYGQTLKPLFFVHAIGTTAQRVRGTFVNMAQIEACTENDDMILVGAPTFAPRPNIHLSGNGYRWYAELFAKIIYQSVFYNYKFTPIQPVAFKAVDKQVIITHIVPCPPLQLDLHTVQDDIPNFGLQVYPMGQSNPVVGIEVNGCDVIVTFTNTVSGTFEFVYASYGTTAGRGNICDSDKWATLYNYLDDSEDPYTADDMPLNYRPKDENGNFIFGKKYPMQNWCVPYTYYITF